MTAKEPIKVDSLVTEFLNVEQDLGLWLQTYAVAETVKELRVRGQKALMLFNRSLMADKLDRVSARNADGKGYKAEGVSNTGVSVLFVKPDIADFSGFSLTGTYWNSSVKADKNFEVKIKLQGGVEGSRRFIIGDVLGGSSEQSENLVGEAKLGLLEEVNEAFELKARAENPAAK